MYDVAIVGAGVIGGITARTLSKYDLRICILERESDVAMGATKANSAIIHAGFDAKEGSLKAKLNVKGSQMMPELCRQLGVMYENNGSLVVGFHLQDRAMLESLLERGAKNGVPGLRILEKEELLQLEPNLSDEVLCALYAPTGAIVCPYNLTIAAIGNAMDNGADLKCNFEVCAIEKSETGDVQGGIVVTVVEGVRRLIARREGYGGGQRGFGGGFGDLLGGSLGGRRGIRRGRVRCVAAIAGEHGQSHSQSKQGSDQDLEKAVLHNRTPLKKWRYRKFP